MSKPYLINFYSIATLLFSSWIFCSNITFCDNNSFDTICNSVVVPEVESHEVSMSLAQEALVHFLAMAQAMTDTRDKDAWIDCVALYNETINHLNLSTTQINPIDAEKWLNATIVNHQACLNVLKDSNFSKSVEDLLAVKIPLASKISSTKSRGSVQLTEGGVITQVNLVVAQDGSGDFVTITEAIEASETQRSGTDRFAIYVKSGIYKENVFVKESMINLMLIGEGIDATIITNDRNFIEGYLTENTATVKVWGLGFIAAGITFENTAGPEKQQAIALLSTSDHSAFYRCSFKGYQDTLCIMQHRQIYRECDIYGTVDFIFGDATTVLQNCNIYLRNPLVGQANTITAQGRTDPSLNTGFVIHNSRVLQAPDTTLDGSVRTFLGRPWRDFSRVVYVKCDLDIVDPSGWSPFKGDTAFDKVYYAEYMNTGKGADTGGRVTWPGYHVLTSDEEVESFSVSQFLDGESWIPQTGVPFDSGI